MSKLRNAKYFEERGPVIVDDSDCATVGRTSLVTYITLLVKEKVAVEVDASIDNVSV